MNKSTFTAQLRIEAIVAEAQKELTNFGNSLKKAWQGGEPPKNLLRTYEEMRVRLESLKQISEKGLVDTSDLRQAENDFRVFQKDIHNLAVEFKLMSVEQKRAMLSTEEQAAMKARTAAVKEYTDAIKKNQDIAKQRKPLEEQRETTLKKQEPARSKAQATLDISGPALKAIEERGALLSKEAQIYKNNTEWAKKYEDQIKRLQSKPNKTESDNKSIAKKQAELDALDLKTGKEQYDREVALHETEVQKLRDAVNAAKQEMEEMDSVVDKLDKQLAKLNPTDETKQLEKLKERLKELGVEGIDDAKDIDTLRKAIQQLDNKAFARVEQSLQDMNAGLGAMGTEALKVGRELDTTTDAIKRQEEALRNQEAFEGKIKQFLGMTGAVELLRRAMTSAFATIKELDAAMTEMAVVTDIDISGYWDQLPEYTERANELGLTIKDVYQADTLFYQQGLKTNEVVELSTQTMRMARVAGLDTAEATDRMTAALRGFNMELNEANAQRIADVYSELAAITASDVDEISSAMTKTASIAASAGMEFETTAAFLSQIIETTRESAETAGTALKTVIARFQELKKDPSEIGEVEGEIVDANKIETALRSVGVALRDSSGQFRDLDDVFLELSSKWDTLDKNTQRYIATIAAGSRQQSRFIAMMSDYARTQELVSAATNSAGANQEQFEKTMDSISAKLNKLKNAWNEFSMGILESDLVKAGVDILTAFLKVINQATSAFDGLGGSIMKIVTVIGMFNVAKKIFAKIKQPIIDVFSEIVAEAYKKGEEAARAYADGARAGAENQPETPTHKNETEEPEKTSFKDKAGEKIKDITGITKMGAVNRRNKALDALKEYEASSFDLDEKKALQAKKKKHGWKKDGSESAAKGAENSRKEYENLTKEIEDYERTTKEAQKSAKQAWKEVGEGAAQMGATIAGVGIGVSMLGGTLEELGVEGTEWITKLGNGITMAGSAMSALGPTITGIVGKLVAGGMSAAAAWAWVAIVVAAIVAVAVIITEAVEAANNASPEKKLERAEAAAEAAANAANDAAEAYEQMRDALEGIDEQQKALKDLARNTSAWKTAVAKLNGEILDLIQRYPQLAKFVEHSDGVMSIDFESGTVQATLDEAQRLAQEAQLVATGAQIDLLAAQNAAAYDRLSRKAKIEYIDPEAAAAAASVGADFTNIAGTTAAGFGIGSLFLGYGNLIGTAGGLIVGILTTLLGDGGEQAGKAAAEAAEAQNDRTQGIVEGVAQAIASGKIIDAGGRYELAEGVTDMQLQAEYKIGLETMNEFYSSLSDATEELRDFGTALNEREAMEDAYYDAMAVQIYNNTDKTGWFEEDKAIGDYLIDGDAIEAERDKILEKLEDVDMLDKNLDDETKQRISNSIQEVYGAGAQVVKDEENGGYKIIDSAGATKRVNITSEDLKNIVATQEATSSVENIAKMMPQIRLATVAAFQSSGTLADYDKADVEKAVLSVLDSESGESLTQEQLAMFNKLSDAELEKIYSSSSILQEAFATSADFVTKLKTPIANAGKAFDQASDAFKKMPTELQNSLSGLTSGAQFGLANDTRLGAIYSTGTTEEIAVFEKAFGNILQSDNVEEIISHMNTIDWTNLESLIGMEYELQELYGVSAEDAQALVASMINATNASTTLDSNIKQFGELYSAVQKLNKALENAADLVWEYEYVLKRGGSTTEIANNIAEQKKETYEAGQQALDAYEETGKNRAEHYGKGAVLLDGIDLTEYVKLDPVTDLYDATEFSRRVEESDLSGTQKETAMNWFNTLVDYQKQGNEYIKTAKESYQTLQQIEDMQEQAFWNLYDTMSNVITSEMEKEIELQEATLEATKNANAQLLKKMQDQIAATRQLKENEEAEENIADLSSQLAYLQMGTSGSILEQLELQEELDAAKEDYQNSLVDQKLQQLADTNARAEEQRERQISLAEQQLDIYKNSAQFEQDVYNLIEELKYQYQSAEEENLDFMNTELGQRIKRALTEGLDPAELDKFWNELGINLGNVSANTDDVESTSMQDLLTAIKQNTSVDANTFQSAYETAISHQDQANNFQKDTLFKIPGKIDYESYVTRDPKTNDITKFDISGLNNYTDSVKSVVGYQETLHKLNDDGKKAYKSAPLEIIKNSTELPELLDIDEFYRRINDGATVGVGDNFVSNTDLIMQQMQGQSEGVDYSYNGYVQAYKEAFPEAWLEGRHKAVDTMKEYIDKHEKDRNFTGMETVVSTPEYKAELVNYQLYGGGSEEEFKDQIKGEINSGIIDVSADCPFFYANLSAKADFPSGEVWFDGVSVTQEEIASLGLPSASDSLYRLRMIDDELYFSYFRTTFGTNIGPMWIKVTEGQPALYNASIKKLRAYKTGGLADFTGPAWLDGTKAHPELVLNAQDTANFIQLRNILSEIMEHPVASENNSSTGDNYFDIEINVESLENDYDVEQLADKIRSMIYDDASYRNVNAISRLR